MNRKFQVRIAAAAEGRIVMVDFQDHPYPSSSYTRLCDGAGWEGVYNI